MPDEAYLREKAPKAVENGKLPRRRPDRTWEGPGTGAACAVCENPVTKDEVLKSSSPHDGGNPDLTSSTFTFAASPCGSLSGQGRSRRSSARLAYAARTVSLIAGSSRVAMSRLERNESAPFTNAD
jgi:hypothetical protein